MKTKKLLVVLLISSLNLFAQTEEQATSSNPLDLTVQKEQIEKYGVPTISAVEEMKNKADALYSAKSWEEAASAYEIYANHANWLANLLSKCLEPYYSASYDKRKAMSYSKLKTFIPLEKKANYYKMSRNEAYVKIGLCYKNTGDIKSAATYLHKGLELLDINNLEYWTIAKDAMIELVEFK